MRIFDTLTAKKETFKPINPSKIGMYVCGPTVYDLGHVGHGRSAVSFDIMRRYLKYKGYQVTFVTNYTDIDDKLIRRAGELKITVKELAERIIPEYARDYADLGVLAADFNPKATEYVAEMIELIQNLEKKGFTYVLDDGVYFEVSKFPEYGKLSKQKLDELQSGARVDVKVTKRNPQDFVLWKFSKPGEPTWESPWGAGRPGWHIECSAMSRKLLGQPFDIHGGGLDLIFPHHECEIAQSEGAYQQPLARYWLHNGFININKEKMSKSLGNFFTLREIFQKYSPQALRLLFLQTHYRSPIEFSDKVLEQAKNSLMRLHDFARRLEGYQPEKSQTQTDFTDKLIAETRQKFEAGLDDDFETSEALAAWFDFVKDMNRLMDINSISAEGKEKARYLMEALDNVLGVLQPIQKEEITAEIDELIKKREEARKVKNWEKSDEIRDQLLKMGIQLEDSAKGTVWKRINN
jgi:cysteinyl-tRNA synthetase